MKKVAIVCGFLARAIVSAVALGETLLCGDSCMVLLSLATLLIGLAGMGFVVMDYL